MKLSLNVCAIGLSGAVFLPPPAAQAMMYISPGGAGIQVSYQIEDWLHRETLNVISGMEAVFERELDEIPLFDVVEKAGRGDPLAERFLICFYMEKLREGENEFGDYFQDMEVSFEDLSSVQRFFQGSGAPEDFIKGLLGVLRIRGNPRLTEANPQLLEQSLLLLLKAKESGRAEFQFVSAFLQIELGDFTRSNDEESAKKTILSLALEGYPPAQYIQGFLSLMDEDVNSAAGWFQKSRERNYQKESSTVFLGELLAFLSDHRSEMYLREAVYDYHFESLKPYLFEVCMQQDKIVPAFLTAKEIAENYTKYPLRVSLAAMNSLAGFLVCGVESERQDFTEAYTWLERARLTAKENRIPLAPEHATLSTALKKQIPFKERVRAEKRALALYKAAEEYSRMDGEFVDDCKAVFH